MEGGREAEHMGPVYGSSIGRGWLALPPGLLIEKVIELVTCVRSTKQRAEETNELVICPGKLLKNPFQAEQRASGDAG